jgi:hypothetical protein
MAQKLLIHIGAHKTGTTSLQTLFHENREELAGLGYCYPRSGVSNTAQHRLAYALLKMLDRANGDVPNFSAEAKDICNEIGKSNCPAAVVSSEFFFALSPENAAKIKDAFSQFEIKILAVLRRPDTMFESIYNQAVKVQVNNFSRQHSEFLANPVKLTSGLNYKGHLGKWATVLGQNATIVRRIEDFSNVGALAADALGVPKDGLFAKIDRENLSPSVSIVELLRRAKSKGLGAAVMQRLVRVGDSMFPLSARSSPLLSPAERMRILRHFDAMTDEVAKMYFNGDNTYASNWFKEADFPQAADLNDPLFDKIVRRAQELEEAASGLIGRPSAATA